MSSYSVEAVLRAKGADKFASAFQKASGAAERMRQVGGRMKSVGKGMTMGVTLPVVGMGVAIAKTGAQFDDQMSTVKAVSGATGAQMEVLRDQAKDMGMTTRYSASEAASGQEMLARAGFKTKDVISALPSVLDLAAAGAVDLGDAADITSNILSGFGMEATETARVADVLARASADSNVDVQSLGEAFKHVGPVASTLGISIEDTAASIGILGDAGIAGGQAGNMLKRGLLNLSAPTEKQTKLMDELNLEMFDANGNMKDMPSVIKELENGMGDMTAQQKISTLETLFGSQAVAGFAALVDSGSENLGEFSEELNNSEGAASDMHDEMEDNLRGSFTNLTSALEGLSLSFYELGDGAVRDFVDWLTELVKRFIGLDDSTKQTIIIIAGIAAAIGPVLIVLGMLLESVSRVGGAIKALSPLFGGVSLSMFAWIAVIALVAVAIFKLWQTNEDFRSNVSEIWNSLKDIMMALFEAVQPAIMVFIGALMMIVEALMPVIAWVVNAVAAFVGWIAHVIEAYSWITTLIQVLIVIAAAIGTVIAVIAIVTKVFTVVTTIITVLTAAVKILGAIFLFFTSPVGIVIAIIAALVAIVIWLGGKFEWLGNILGAVADFMKGAWNKFLGFFGKGTKDAADEAEDAIEGVSEKGKEDLDGLATEGTASAEELNEGVTGNVEEMTHESGSLMDNLKQDGQLDFEELGDGAVTETELMGDGVTSNIGDMTNESSDMFADLEESGNIDMSNMNAGVTDEVTEMTGDVKSQVGDMESSASGDFSGLSDEMSGNAESVRKSVAKSFTGMSKSIGKEMDNIKNIASSALNSVASDFKKGMDVVNKTVQSSTKALTSTMRSSMMAMTVEVTRGFDRMAQTTQRGSDKMSTTTAKSIGLILAGYRAGFNSINSAISSGMSKAQGTVRSRNSTIVSNTRGLNSRLYSAGVHAMNGLQRGLNARSSGVVATARNIANRVASTMRSALQVRSPSRVMMKIGEHVGEGLANGMQSMARMVDKASSALGLAAIPELEPIGVSSQINSTHARTSRRSATHSTSDVTGQQPINIEVVSVLDGREVSRSTYKYDEEFSERENRRNRMFSQGG